MRVANGDDNVSEDAEMTEEFQTEDYEVNTLWDFEIRLQDYT